MLVAESPHSSVAATTSIRAAGLGDPQRAKASMARAIAFASETR